MKKMNKKGFTIVELVIVIAVIAILAAVLIPTFSGIVEKANMSRAIQEGRNKYTEIYAEDIGDGVIDGKKDGTNNVTPIANLTYTADPATNEVTKVEYACTNGYTATMNVTTGAWTAAKTN